MSYGSYIAELAKEMSPDGVPHPHVFDGLITLLSLLDASGPREDYLRIFEMRLLASAGYHPSFDFCSGCKKPWEKGEPFWFSVPRGGVVCSRCKEGEKDVYSLSLGTAKLLKQACNLTADKMKRLMFSPQAREESGRILPCFIRYQLGKELKSFKFLEKMQQPAFEGPRK